MQNDSEYLAQKALATENTEKIPQFLPTRNRSGIAKPSPGAWKTKLFIPFSLERKAAMLYIGP